MGWVLLTSLGVGLALSCIQVAVEATTARTHLDADIQESLATMRSSASQAVYSLTLSWPARCLMACSRWSRHWGQHPTPKRHRNGRGGAPWPSPYRVLTDLLFDPVREYSFLRANAEPHVLRQNFVSIDTYHAAQRFLRALITFVAGLASVLILAFVLPRLPLFSDVPIKHIIDSLHALIRPNPVCKMCWSLPTMKMMNWAHSSKQPTIARRDRKSPAKARRSGSPRHPPFGWWYADRS